MLDHSNDIESPTFYSELLFNDLDHGVIYPESDISKILSNLKIEKGKYLVIKDERMFVVFRMNLLFLLIKWLGVDVKDYAESLGEVTINQFRHSKKDSLLNGLVAGRSKMKDYLSVLSDYVFCEHFSLWTLNQDTNFFTCEASSYEVENDAIINDENCSFNEILKSDKIKFEERAPKSNFPHCEFIAQHDLKSMTRISLDIGFGSRTPAIVSFYSSKENFYLGDKVSEKIKALVEMRYLERVQLAEEQFERLNADAHPNIKSESLSNYLDRFCKIVSKSLQYEACSIFLKHKENQLKLHSSFDKRGVVKITNSIVYQLGENSMTTRVYIEDRVMCSYDLLGDVKNTHTYDEKTKINSKNWVGLPIHFENSVVGVIRVKNKYIIEDGAIVLRPPRPVHFYNLERMVKLFESSLDIYYKYNDLNEKLSEHDNFTKVLLHEIRTPISKFNTAPEILIRDIEKENIESEKKKKIVSRLRDIQVLGERLKYLTDTYRIEDLLDYKKNEIIPLQSGIIFPLLNTTKIYLEKQHGCYLDFNMESIHSWQVYGDRNLYSMALNALIDNAAKYCDSRSKIIDIFCEYNYGDEFLYLHVRNYGVVIKASERKTIFDNGYRGQAAVKERIHGTGIGLYLAKKIMNSSGGDLFFIPSKILDLNEFVMKIPTPKRVDFNYD